MFENPALQLDPIKPTPNPIDRMNKIAGVENLIQGNQLQRMQMDEIGRKARNDEESRRIAQEQMGYVQEHFDRNSGDIDAAIEGVLGDPRVSITAKTEYQKIAQERSKGSWQESADAEGNPQREFILDRDAPRRGPISFLPKDDAELRKFKLWQNDMRAAGMEQGAEVAESEINYPAYLRYLQNLESEGRADKNQQFRDRNVNGHRIRRYFQGSDPSRVTYEEDLGPWNSDSGSDASALNLTPAGLDAAALNYARTGQLPAMGMGGASAGVRTRIINRAAELYPNLDVASNRADYDANKASLTALQKSRDSIVAFENTAKKNLDIFLSQARRIVDTGSPWINQPLRSVNRAGLGSADQLAFDAARRVAVNEIAKVTSNPNLTGQLSDSARHEVESFIPENATLEQIFRVADVLKRDMENRKISLDEQIRGIRERLGERPGGGDTSDQSREQYSPSTGQYRYTTDGGRTWKPGRLPR